MTKKFRAWNPIKKEYIPYAVEDGFALNGEFVMNQGFFQDDYKLKLEEICSLEFEQYIGRQDIHDKNIFEGDRVRCVEPDVKGPNGSVYLVCFLDLVGVICFRYECFGVLNESDKLFYPFFSRRLNERSIEVIGTVHDEEVTT